MYADNSAANIYRLLHRYYRYQKIDTDSMSEHLGRMDEMRRALADLGEKQSETLYQVTVIGSLPPEYQIIMEVWELTHPDMRTTPNLVARLLKKEEDVKATGGGQLLLMKGKDGRRWEELSIKERKKISKCAACGTQGHWARECPNANKEDQKETEQKRETKPAGKAKVNVIFSLGKLGTGLRSKWVLDSGATEHICNEKSWFSTLTMYSKPLAAAVGNGDKIEVWGKGTVVLASQVGQEEVGFTLKDVSYIPQVATNLPGKPFYHIVEFRFFSCFGHLT